MRMTLPTVIRDFTELREYLLWSYQFTAKDLRKQDDSLLRMVKSGRLLEIRNIWNMIKEGEKVMPKPLDNPSDLLPQVEEIDLPFNEEGEE